MDLRSLNTEQRAQVLRQIEQHQHEDYETDIKLAEDKVLRNFAVHKHVLRPEGMASLTLARWISEHVETYSKQRVLDMGCGSGIQGIVMGLYGAREVTFTDISSSAVNNAKENIKRYRLGGICEVFQGDLFEKISSTYGFIVFNHPFFPANAGETDPIAKSMLDDGALLSRFLTESHKYLAADGCIVMPYFHLAGDVNNPDKQGPRFGYDVEEVYSEIPQGLIQNGQVSIYKLWSKGK